MTTPHDADPHDADAHDTGPGDTDADDRDPGEDAGPLDPQDQPIAGGTAGGEPAQGTGAGDSY